ncbi:MAG TPA: class I SAM-dependent methyltransferase [Pyrinomonadaceae bacterium]|nr:class I SAM-dependent methyltransferase [Pyrinomonadaceae bacterium]
MQDVLGRFSNRVSDYVKYRPGYPPAVLELLREECGLTPASVVADVGSGTGILSELFLKNGNLVYGVEPNREMREAGERLLSAYENFKSVDGRAEATTLGDASVDFVTAGQALHWFEPRASRREFARVLRGGGWLVVVWNERRLDSTPFLAAYERLLQTYGTDYKEVAHADAGGALIGGFFGEGGARLKSFDNAQTFDLGGLRGRLRSASYTPEPSHPNFEAMMAELERLFVEHERGGRVVVEYDTNVYYGQLRD